jgi:pilus assembly protein CpaF
MNALDHERLVDQLCRVAAEVPGDAHEVVSSRIGTVAPLIHGAVREELIRAAVARLTGLDRLDALMTDPEIDEILVNRGGEVWVERAGRLEAAEAIPATSIPVVLERVLAPLGRRLDRSNPIVDARLPDGSRICAVIAPVAVDGTALAIRRFRRRALTVADFCGTGVAAVLCELLERRNNILVTGNTSSGKTSLLGALIGQVPASERILVLEDTAELCLEAPHLVRLEARAPTPDGPRAISLDELVHTALRLRPDRLVLGEVRGPEVIALLQAMNTGHDGSLSTCHANGPSDAISRLETLVLQAAPSWPLSAIRAQLSRSIDAVVHVTRTSTAARRIAAIAEMVESKGPPQVRMLTSHDQILELPTRSRT